MINCLANKILEFKNENEKAKTIIGFCQLPDWVQIDLYFKAAIMDGSIKTFQGSSNSVMENVLKLEEKAAKLRDETKVLEEQKELSNTSKIATEGILDNIKFDDLLAEKSKNKKQK